MAAEVGTTEPLRLRVALVGCGRIRVHHVAALNAVRDVEIVAVCDLDEKAAREAATRHGIRGCYTDAEAMLRETRPDAVHLLTPPGSHLALARLVAKYGAHMYIEEPFAATQAEARAILELAREAGVQVCPGHSRLFDPVFVETCRRIRAGEIGRVISVRAEQGFTYEAVARSASIPWSYSYDWGTFDKLICHPLYLACHFLTVPGRLARTLTQVTNGRIRPVFAPYPMVWLAMLAADLISLVRHRKLGTARYRLQHTLAPMRFECAAARQDLGWRPRVTLAEGLARVMPRGLSS